MRPGKNYAILLHLVPCYKYSLKIKSSSCVSHCPFFTLGERLLNHRSLHCLPERPEIICAACAHLPGPSSFTHSMSRRSSSGIHGPFTSPGFRIFVHRCKHYMADRPFMCLLTLRHYFSPLF